MSFKLVADKYVSVAHNDDMYKGREKRLNISRPSPNSRIHGRNTFENASIDLVPQSSGTIYFYFFFLFLQYELDCFLRRVKKIIKNSKYLLKTSDPREKGTRKMYTKTIARF